MKKSIVPASFETYQVVDPNDIIIRPTDLQNDWNSLRVGISRNRGIITSAYLCLKTIGPLSPDYGYLLLHTYDLMKIFYGMGSGLRQNLDFTDLKWMPVVIPPQDEQDAIAAFLAHAVRRINRLIRAKRRLIKLLHEQKQAIINRAVTSGLDPKARLKPSGVEWLGEVPEHWEIRRLKTLAHMRSGESITGLSINDTGDYPVFGGNGMRGYTFTYTHEGDYVLIGRQGALCGNVHYARGRFFASEHAIIASLFPGHDLMWYGELLRVMNLNQYSMAAAQPGLAVECVQNLWVPVPPLAEQSRIAQHIQSETGPVNLTIARAQREIALIREYRTRLIADVVTGKVDVRNVKCEERRVKEGDEDRWDEIGDTGDNEGLIDAESNIGETDKEVEEV